MKKSIIAAGAASVALAAMPIVGAFADGSVTDSIKANIGAGCTASNNGATNDVTLSVTPGSLGTSDPSAGIQIICNSDNWAVSALASSANLTYGSNTIATGTATSGNTSAWAFKIAEADNATIADTYKNFTAVPTGTAVPVVTGSAAATTTVKAQYQVYAATAQASGEYTGSVTYTVATVDGD